MVRTTVTEPAEVPLVQTTVTEPVEVPMIRSLSSSKRTNLSKLHNLFRSLRQAQ